ncbi:MAG: class I SAM-dependent methyltransferase [Anaerolineales bacterium]|nr:class I SAM-dependent methyltransferase [Anaerolineales bacterium]
MPHPDALYWDDRYTHETSRRIPRSPRHLVVAHLDLLPRNGLILDVACGTTSTGRLLASRGWRVIAIDVSIAALRLAQPQVRKEALPVSMAVMDLTDPWLPREHFDVILNFYYLLRPLWKTYRAALKPGGLLFFETFLREADMTPDHYLDPLELKIAFDDWEIIRYAEIQRSSHSPDHPDKKRRIAQLVARKPS